MRHTSLSLFALCGALAACGGSGGDDGPRSLIDTELRTLAARADAASFRGLTLPTSGVGIYDGRAELQMDTSTGSGARAHQGDHRLTADSAFTVQFGGTRRISGELRHFAMPDAPAYQVLGTMNLAQVNLTVNSASGYFADLPIGGELIYRQAGHADAIRTITGGEINAELRGPDGQFVNGLVYAPSTAWTEGSLRGSFSGRVVAER